MHTCIELHSATFVATILNFSEKADDKGEESKRDADFIDMKNARDMTPAQLLEFETHKAVNYLTTNEDLRNRTLANLASLKKAFAL